MMLYLSEKHRAVSRHRAILQPDTAEPVEDKVEAEYLAYLESAVRKYDHFMEMQAYIPFTTYEQRRSANLLQGLLADDVSTCFLDHRNYSMGRFDDLLPTN